MQWRRPSAPGWSVPPPVPVSLRGPARARRGSRRAPLPSPRARWPRAGDRAAGSGPRGPAGPRPDRPGRRCAQPGSAARASNPWLPRGDPADRDWRPGCSGRCPRGACRRVHAPAPAPVGCEAGQSRGCPACPRRRPAPRARARAPTGRVATAHRTPGSGRACSSATTRRRAGRPGTCGSRPRTVRSRRRAAACRRPVPRAGHAGSPGTPHRTAAPCAGERLAGSGRARRLQNPPPPPPSRAQGRPANRRPPSRRVAVARAPSPRAS